MKVKKKGAVTAPKPLSGGKLTNRANPLNRSSADSSFEEELFRRLAALPPTDYDRMRKLEAAKLGVRPLTLDREVDSRRPRSCRENMQGTATEFSSPQPWQSPVNPADLLSDVAGAFYRYLALPPGAADALALWTAHTHCYEAFPHTPRCHCSSPDKGCGKTTTLDVLATMTPRPMRAENITSAVLFRLVDQHRPTLLLDEVDSYLNDADELRGLLNAGHKRGARAYRCEGDSNTVRSFSAHAPAVLAGIGAIHGTLHDRSIVIKLPRAKRCEVQARFDSRRVEHETVLCRKLARWTADNFAKLQSCDPQLPETAFNRLADNWRPLFAIAEVAGGDWPRRALASFTALTATDDLDAQGIGSILLADIQNIFSDAGVDRMPSNELADALAGIEGRPWAEWGKHRRPISANQLAQQLRRFGIAPHVIRIGDQTPRGYWLDDFKEAFSRYLPGTPFPDRNTATTLGKTVVSEPQQPELVLQPEKGASQRECCTVAPCTEGERHEILI
jgi:putative DNA primase/helicase